MTASEIFALSYGSCCEGPEQCHWCGAPCQRLHRHSEQVIPAVSYGNRIATSARLPAKSWVCTGCILFRRPSITVFWYDGGLDDRRCAMDHNWLITETQAHALRPGDTSLYDFLLSPPSTFTLMLLSNEADEKKEKNQIHLAVVNRNNSVKPDTELHYTFDNRVMSYTTEELKAALTDGSLPGKAGGVRMLIEFLGETDRYIKKAAPGRPKRSSEDAAV